MAVVAMSNVTPGVASGIQEREVTITSDEMLALHTTPKVIIPSPGPGLTIILMAISVDKPSGTAYTSVGANDDLEIRYNNASGHEIMDIETDGFLDNAAARNRHGEVAPADYTRSSNVPVVARLGGQVLDGDTPVYVKARYYIETIR